MLSPKGKSKAASIWSVDSGYASNTAEESSHADFYASFLADRTPSSACRQPLGLGVGDFCNLSIEDELHVQRPGPLIDPVTTKINVFTTKVGSSSDFQLPASDAKSECVLCQLWDITNPGEHLMCDECSRTDPSSSAIYEQPRPKSRAKSYVSQLETTGPPQRQYGSKTTGTERCSSCTVSALNLSGHTATCIFCTPELAPAAQVPVPNGPEVKRSCARRPPTKLESHALRCLKAWLRANNSNPYPDADAKRSLAQQCGISEKQVTTWFTNARARQRIAKYAETSALVSDEGLETDWSSSKRTTPMLDETGNGSCGTLPDLQGADRPHLTSISHGQETSPVSRRGKKKYYGHLGVTSRDNKQPPAKLSTPSSATAINDTSKSNVWQCTFCYQHVSPKSWRRHEETQHRPKRKWTCLHTGPAITAPSRSALCTYCAFCMLSNPSEEHLQNYHRINECMGKTEKERTFLRPDHLRQHVRNFHLSSLSDVVRDLWRREGALKHGTEAWNCGFCSCVMGSWDARQTHLARHFKDGLTMAHWSPSPEPAVGFEASKKRLSSSEGRPNVFAKLARTFTGRKPQLRGQTETQSWGASISDHVSGYTDTSLPTAPLLPDLVFSSFMAEVCGDDFNDGEASGTICYNQGITMDDLHSVSAPHNHEEWLELFASAETLRDEEFSQFLDFW